MYKNASRAAQHAALRVATPWAYAGGFESRSDAEKRDDLKRAARSIEALLITATGAHRKQLVEQKLTIENGLRELKGKPPVTAEEVALKRKTAAQVAHEKRIAEAQEKARLAKVYRAAAREGMIEARREEGERQRALKQAAHQAHQEQRKEAARVAREMRIAAHQGRMEARREAANANGNKRVRSLQSKYNAAMEEMTRPEPYWG